MRHRRPKSLIALSFATALLVLSSCKGGDDAPAPQTAPKATAFRVTAVQVGNAIGADKKVTHPGETFKPGDTIYASVLSEGAAQSVALSAKWTFEDGQVVNESTQKISPNGPAVTEFHISKADGWPAGKYKLEVMADGKPAGAANFTVAG